jgi:hypothetical protein
LLTGIVDSDRFTDVGILFPALWTDAHFEGVMPRGTPIAQCFPILREALDLHFQPFSAEEAERYESTANILLSHPGAYRRRFRVRRERSSPKQAAQSR